jgi:hypothetical protein
MALVLINFGGSQRNGSGYRQAVRQLWALFVCVHVACTADPVRHTSVQDAKFGGWGDGGVWTAWF